MVRPSLPLCLMAVLLLATAEKAIAQVAAPASAGPTLSPPSLPLPAPPAPTFIGATGSPSIYPSPEGSTEVIIPPSGQPTSDAWCIPPQEPGRTSSWTAAIELIPSITRVTDSQFGRWTDDGATALRLILGYEDPQGIGIRARFWGLSQEAEVPADDVELSMGKFDLDLYKRFWLDGGELALGVGPSSGSLEFQLSDDTHSEFTGAGATMFLDGYYGLMQFEKSELGAVGRGRYSILLGDWRDTTGVLIPPTDNDTLSVVELAWGLEYRRRFGSCEDHSWFVGVLAEYQRWQSDWMARFASSSLGVSGVNIYTGINW